MEEISRPLAAPSPGERAREWIEWFGVARLVTSAVAVVVVCAGAWWLVRSPAPPTEASLPVASVATDGGSAPTVTLPPPVAPTESSTGAVDAGGEVVVHVAGAVARPGVYQVEPGSRIQAAIDLAGGPTSAADHDALNLAAIVVDGSRVYVPEVGEAFSPPTEPDEQPGVPTGPVDVNRAGTDELETLPGVGPATATAIVTERDRNGPFASVDDLDRVPGIGPAKLEALRDLVAT